MIGIFAFYISYIEYTVYVLYKGIVSILGRSTLKI